MGDDYDQILGRLQVHLKKMTGSDTPVGEDQDLVTQLGLDSVRVLDLVMEIEDEFDMSIPMNVLADVRTVRDLAQAIQKLEENA